MTTKNTVIALVVVVLVIIGITLWSTNARNESVSSDESSEETGVTTPSSPASKLVGSAYTRTRVLENGKYVSVVTLTDKGFVPKVIELNRGETVRFVNNSSSAMRIASDDFEGVPLYTGLNQEKSVGKNGVYALEFTEAGVWAYNNLANPGVIGGVWVK